MSGLWDDLPVPYQITGQQPPIEFQAGPTFGPMLSDTRIAHHLTQWRDQLGVVDHQQCEHPDCDAWLCFCLDREPHAGCEDNWCTHYRVVCDAHRTEVCDDCRRELAERDHYGPFDDGWNRS